MNHFISDLHFGQVSELVLLEKLKEQFPLAEQVKDKTCDISIPVKIEVKRERAVKRYGNIAIELEYKGTPSGPFASEADIWVWEIDGVFWWAYKSDLLTWLKDNEDKYEVKMGGDGKKSKLALIKMLTFCNEVASKFS